MTTNAKAEDLVPLPPYHLEILVSLSGKDSHGYGMIGDIKERSGGLISLGASTLYAAIKRLVDLGLIEDAGDRESDESGGPPRRYYRITEFGREVARLEGLRMKRASELLLGSAVTAAPTSEAEART